MDVCDFVSSCFKFLIFSESVESFIELVEVIQEQEPVVSAAQCAHSGTL